MAEAGFQFSSANSINIGRLVPQIVYYVYAYTRLLADGEIKAGDKINAVVPTGNFGNILAAFYAKNMGLPINKLICASNENKVLYDFLQHLLLWIFLFQVTLNVLSIELPEIVQRRIQSLWNH